MVTETKPKVKRKKYVRRKLAQKLVSEIAQTENMQKADVKTKDELSIKPEPNCLNIYPREKGGVKFEYMDNPIGYMYQCLNNNKWYYVHIWNKESKKLELLVFSDKAFFNPKELAQVVGAEPWRRFFEHHNELLEKIAPWLPIGAMGILVFALLIFGGN